MADPTSPGRMERVNPSASSPDPRQGAFWRATTVVYWYVVVEGCFLLAAAPGFAGILLLERDASNIPLYALCLLPLGPAFSAAVSTMAARMTAEEPNVWPRFWRAYARNLGDVLWVWVPALAIATVLGTTVAFGAAAGVDLFFTGAAIVLLVVVALWASHALMIASFFRFRARDIARLALYYLAAKPLVTLGSASYLVLATAVVAFGSDWMLALTAVVFAAFAGANARPMVADVTQRFTADDG
ncbi:uncharacterized protein DUF624 [Microbacterium sp. SLBN-154]|uniref:DUF624 domain-containing protein n=1 Tax=Microbacterium sp. SLBN-154 TaxID=2768458 RepID=UPI00114FA3C8|nr:DUF624 domain-containing protein [Microbacterium sp. SLBN-154]TQK20923.1 uncharacterized protein DUF624 [Microbacterium sp. SLBN-154]